MERWDGGDYQFWCRACIVAVLVGYAVTAWKAGAVDEVFVMSMFFGLIGIAIVPSGPKPPE